MVLSCESGEGGEGRGRKAVTHQKTWCSLGPCHLLQTLLFSQGAHSVLVSPLQAPVDPELSLYDLEEETPSYWDLEQVS